MWHLKVPKIMHCYWGSHILSWLRYLTIKTFNIQNPDWVIKFYYPKQAYSGGAVWNQGYAEAVTGENWFDRVKDIPNVQMIELDFNTMGIGYIPDVFRSDILRLKMLADEGGLWSDMDVLYFKPMDEACFNQPNSNIDTVISYNTKPNTHHYSIGFLMSAPNNVFYTFLYGKSLEHKNQNGEYQHLGITMWHRYFPIPQSIERTFPNLNVYNIDMWLCYHYCATDAPIFVKKDLPFTNSRTIAFHWYGGHHDCIPYESAVTPNNYMTFNNTISSTIKRALNQ